jgi:hypothetical protein
MDYIFQKECTSEIKEELSKWVNNKLTELFGDTDAELAEYVLTMVQNKKNIGDINLKLADFFSDSVTCKDFVDG